MSTAVTNPSCQPSTSTADPVELRGRAVMTAVVVRVVRALREPWLDTSVRNWRWIPWARSRGLLNLQLWIYRSQGIFIPRGTAARTISTWTSCNHFNECFQTGFMGCQGTFLTRVAEKRIRYSICSDYIHPAYVVYSRFTGPGWSLVF